MLLCKSILIIIKDKQQENVPQKWLPKLSEREKLNSLTILPATKLQVILTSSEAVIFNNEQQGKEW